MKNVLKESGFYHIIQYQPNALVGLKTRGSVIRGIGRKWYRSEHNPMSKDQDWLCISSEGENS